MLSTLVNRASQLSEATRSIRRRVSTPDCPRAQTLSSLARNSSRGVSEVTEEIRTANPTERFGHPDEFGATCAFLCSVQAGYITGQNVLIDGGAYPGTF